MRFPRTLTVVVGLALLAAVPTSVRAQAFTFSTGDPDGKVATASRPSSTGKVEIESADDFLLSSATRLDGGTFTGLLPAGVSLSSIEGVTVEIYRVFPKDSTDPPSGNVVTRANSPSDVAFDSRSTGGSTLTFTASVLNQSFTAANSVLNGINKKPNQTTGGEGAVTGQEVLFDFSLSSPFTLPTDHYFFIPQVQLSTGDFLWLSAPKPIAAPGTPFAPDFQSWIRNENLAPDWSRIGTDVIGQQAYNASFSLRGETLAVPEASTLLSFGGPLLLLMAGAAGRLRVRRRC